MCWAYLECPFISTINVTIFDNDNKQAILLIIMNSIVS